jgi:hypothetical protein
MVNRKTRKWSGTNRDTDKQGRHPVNSCEMSRILSNLLEFS